MKYDIPFAFAETKKSNIGDGSKVPHLAYVGDGELEENVNFSAGAITVINAAYFNEYHEIPSFLVDDIDNSGGFEGFSGNEGYNSSFYGIVNLSGAVGNKDWIIEGDIPIVSMHGDQDDVVPYDNSLVTLFGLNVLVDGSYIIHQRMLELENYSNLHTYVNEGHSPYTNMDFEAEYSSSFLYEIVCSSDLILGDLNQDESFNILDIIELVLFIRTAAIS